LYAAAAKKQQRKIRQERKMLESQTAGKNREIVRKSEI